MDPPASLNVAGKDLLGVDTVRPENAAGAQALVQAMVALGHRRFAVLAGPPGLLTARERRDGFRAGLAAWSVPLAATQVIHGPFSRDGGYEAMSAILAAGQPRPDCVFAVTDVMALGALARLRAGRPARAGRHRPGRVRRHRHPARRRTRP
jgi:LacI family transcriptional regulator